MKQENFQLLPAAGSLAGDNGSGMAERVPPVPCEGSATHLLAVQRDFSIALLHSSSLEEALEILLAAVLLLPEFDGGGVYLRDDGDEVPRRIAYQGRAERLVESVAGDAGSGTGPRFLGVGSTGGDPDMDAPPGIASAMIAENISALAVIPLCERGRSVAMLGVFSNHHPQIGNNSRVVLESLAAQTETAIGLARARSTGKAAKRELRLAVEGAELGTWSSDPTAGFFNASPRARELHGIPADAPMNTDLALAAIHPEDRPEVAAVLERVMVHGGSFSCEYRTTVKADGEHWVASQATSHGEDGRLYGIVRDITVQKRTEKALREAHDQLELRVAERTTELEAANAALREESRRLEMALAASQAGTWALTIGGETLEWDNRSRALFGFENDIPVSFADAQARLHPDGLEVFLENFHQMVRPGGGDIWSQEFRIDHPTRGERWIAGIGSIERDEAGHALRMSGINLDITRRKHSQKTLNASVDFATNLMRSMQDGFSVLNVDGVAVDANPAFCQMTGFSRDELVGAAPPHPYWPPEEYARIQDALDETLNQNGSTSELTFMRKTGQRFPVIVSAFPVLNQNGVPISYAATVKDITGRKDAEEAMRGWNQTLERRVAVRTAELKQSEDRFRQLVDATFEGVVISENGVVIDGNPQIAAMLGSDFPGMIGRPVTDFIAPESRALVLKRLSEGFEAPYEYTGLRLDGTKVPMEAHGRMMIWQGKEARVTALRDLTSKKLAEARIEAQKAELDQALRLALVSEVSAGIIHQIGQPLSAIGASLAAAVVRCKSGEVTNRETLQLIEETALHVARMRDSVIHLRALADPEQPNRVPVNFNGMVSDALQLMRAEAASLRFHLTIDMAPGLPLLLADTVQLSQVVINLVRNALDACADCPPERRAVRIRTRAFGHRQLELSVRDSGTGIPPTVMDHLYSPFFTTKPDGFGIGLRLSRTIVKAHGGSIEGSNNSDGVGATFRVVLPLDSERRYTKV
jgi:PAS domain S-box-containing protein